MRNGGAALSLAVGTLVLSACGFMPDTEHQTFDVTAEAAWPHKPGTPGFHNEDPNINAALAAGMCADGYRTEGGANRPADGAALSAWHVACAEYNPHFF